MSHACKNSCWTAWVINLLVSGHGSDSSRDRTSVPSGHDDMSPFCLRSLNIIPLNYSSQKKDIFSFRHFVVLMMYKFKKSHNTVSGKNFCRPKICLYFSQVLLIFLDLKSFIIHRESIWLNWNSHLRLSEPRNGGRDLVAATPLQTTSLVRLLYQQDNL